MLDGRHTGTGGGNHIVLGGATPPIARSCAGPTCCEPARLLAQPSLAVVPVQRPVHRSHQPAPRVDEARNDCPVRARDRLPPGARCGSGAPEPVAGRSHAPQPAGRRDRQHAPRRVLHRQAVLPRRQHRSPRPAGAARLRDAAARAHEPGAAVAAARPDRPFWKQPYEPTRLQRWGTELHDRFLLPHFVWQTTSATCWRIFGARATRLRSGVVQPHFEFRFPQVGDFTTRGVEVELRHALEPWHVLGEEAATGGTVRYVDSSLERSR
jgi:hypothetical protein